MLENKISDYKLVKEMHYVKYHDGSFAGYTGRTQHFACARFFSTKDDANNYALEVYSGYPYEIQTIK